MFASNGSDRDRLREGGEVVTDKKIDFLNFFDLDGKTGIIFVDKISNIVKKREKTFQLIFTNLQKKIQSFPINCLFKKRSGKTTSIICNIEDDKHFQAKSGYIDNNMATKMNSSLWNI